jgi:hypothetical protein
LPVFPHNLKSISLLIIIYAFLEEKKLSKREKSESPPRKKASSDIKVPNREKYMDALLVSGQIFTAPYFPKLEEAIKLHLANNETDARTKFNEACADANIPQEMVWELWDTITRITPKLEDESNLAWLTGING